MRNTRFDKPLRINWKVIAGNDDLHPIQMYDIVFDTHDLNIRQLKIS